MRNSPLAEAVDQVGGQGAQGVTLGRSTVDSSGASDAALWIKSSCMAFAPRYDQGT